MRARTSLAVCSAVLLSAGMIAPCAAQPYRPQHEYTPDWPPSVRHMDREAGSHGGGRSYTSGMSPRAGANGAPGTAGMMEAGRSPTGFRSERPGDTYPGREWGPERR